VGDTLGGTSGDNRHAKYCRITTAGRNRLWRETEQWQRLTDAVGFVLGAVVEES
jgi:hypothetical protein